MMSLAVLKAQFPMVEQLLRNQYIIPLIFGFIFGLLSRIYLLQTDYRQYPTRPHGKVIHLALGVIAAALGSVAVPAFLKEDYTAVTFLTLAAQQFRDVRNMERTTLAKIDEHELVPRGETYIEGIAMVFEGRNYVVILTAFLTTFATVLFAWWGGLIVGIASLFLAKILKSGKNLGSIVQIQPAELRVEGKDLYVDNIYIMNVGSVAAQKTIRERGMGFILKPMDLNANVTISHPGQRQAISHDLATMLGVFTDQGEPSLTPLIKRDLATGRLGVFFLPIVKDQQKAKEVLENVPLLESVVRLPKESPAYANEEGAR